MCAWRQSGSNSDPAAGAQERRALGLLLEGVAINQLQVDADAYKHFRSGILRSSVQLVEPQKEPDLLHIVRMIVAEFESYRAATEAGLETLHREWRQIAAVLMNLLAARDRTDSKGELWGAFLSQLASATSSDELESLRARLQKLVRHTEEASTRGQAPEVEDLDRSTTNDNPAGLRGGGAAIEHVRDMICASRPGYVTFFRLSCLEVVGERFGLEAIQDCLMTVSAFLIQNLRAEDVVYHWSEFCLLAVCDRKIREEMLTAELTRVLARNRDFTINIRERAVMLRIPISLRLFPVSDFDSVDDLQAAASLNESETILSHRPARRSLQVNL